MEKKSALEEAKIQTSSLLSKIKGMASSGVQNIRGNIQAIANPQTRQEYFTGITKPVQDFRFLAQQIGQQTAPQFLQKPIATGMNTISSIEQNPYSRVPLSFGQGIIQGQNLGMGQRTINPISFPEKVAYTTGSFLGAFNPYSITGRTVGAIVGATNPVLNRVIKPIAGPIASRIASGVANVVQGGAINPLFGGKPFTPQSAAIDFATGVAFGPGQFSGTMSLDKGAFLENPDAKIVAILSNKMEKIGNISIQETGKVLELAKKYLKIPKKEFAKMGTDQILAELGGMFNKNQSFAYRQLPGMGFAETPKMGNQAISGAPKGVQNFQNFLESSSGVSTGAVKNILPRTTINTDKQTQQQAQLLTDPLKRVYQDWVNNRSASVVEGQLKNREFSDLNQKGIRGIFDFQSGDKSGRLADVKKYFDTKYEALQNAGIPFRYKQDYLPQLWANSQQEVNQKLGKSLTMRPSFTLESLLKDYKQGIDVGLTPRFQNISDLVGWYEQTANKTLADHGFFNTLAQEGVIQPATKAPRGWITLNPDRFPRIKINIEGGLKPETYTGVYKAPPEMGGMINNYLNGATHETLQRVADFASASKNKVLSFGIPYTGINAHGTNILARNIMASKNPLEGGITGIKYILNPNSAARYIENNLEKAPFAVKQGLTFSTSEYKSLLDEPQGIRGKFGVAWNKAFEKPLFDKIIPAIKLQKFYEVFYGFKKSGMSEAEAGKQAAQFTNNVFGGINWKELGQSADTQNLKRALILAPDWLQSNINLGKNIIKSFVRPMAKEGQAYRRFGATFLGAYITANIANKLSSGHWMFQNDPGHTFEIEAGTTAGGSIRYIKPFGTAADFARIPMDVAQGLSQGDPSPAFRAIRNRLSTFASPVVGLLTNTDYKGNPVYGKDRYGRPYTLAQNVAGVAGELSPAIGVPSFAKNAVDYATGKQGLEESLTTGLELPFRYSKGTPPSVYAKQTTGARNKVIDLLAQGKNEEAQKEAQKQEVAGVTQKDVLSVTKDKGKDAAYQIITGNINEAKKIVKQYSVPQEILAYELPRVAKTRAVELIRATISAKQKGDTRSAKKFIDEAMKLQQQYGFTVTQKDLQ